MRLFSPSCASCHSKGNARSFISATFSSINQISCDSLDMKKSSNTHVKEPVQPYCMEDLLPPQWRNFFSPLRWRVKTLTWDCKSWFWTPQPGKLAYSTLIFQSTFVCFAEITSNFSNSIQHSLTASCTTNLRFQAPFWRTSVTFYLCCKDILPWEENQLINNVSDVVSPGHCRIEPRCLGTQILWQ